METEKRLIDANKFGMYLADVQLANRGWKEDLCDLPRYLIRYRRRADHGHRKGTKLLKQEHERAKGLAFVRNPVAYALYRVWKMADGQEGG